MTSRDHQVTSTTLDIGILVCGTVWAVTSFLVLARSTGIHPGLTGDGKILVGAAVGLLSLGGLIWLQRKRLTQLLGSLTMTAMVLGATLLVLILASRLGHFVVIPADIVGFGENGFLDFILKFRAGFPLYTPGQDNNTVPYTPGAPILTYLVASILGDGTSIPLLRALTTITAALAGVVFSFGTANLATLVYGDRFSHRPVWIVTWTALLILMAFDDRFNLYTHTLHNDSAALLVAAAAFWVISRHALTGDSWLLLLMIVLPSIGFLIKQSHVMWIVVFPVYLLLSGRRRQGLTVGAFATVLYGLTLTASWVLWGRDFFFWVFSALGAKEVSLARVVFHFLQAGVLIAFFVFGGWRNAFSPGQSSPRAVWLCSVLVLLLGVWTSGAVWVHNHLGPGAMMATCWFFVGLFAAWEEVADRSHLASVLRGGMLSFVLVALFAGLGHLRNPREEVSADLYRYIAETETEFVGLDPNRVLLDNGNWIYLKTGTLMRDRATPLAVHIGPNQSVMNLEMLEDTKARIRSGVYTKILAHELDTPRTAYDFGDRGSGIPELIFEHYEESHRIPGVKGIIEWWPTQMISEIIVFVRKDLTGFAGRSSLSRVCARSYRDVPHSSGIRSCSGSQRVPLPFPGRNRHRTASY